MTDRTAEREQIVAEAYRSLDKNGGTALSVTEILANTGLSTRAFYRHFKTRDELLLVMLRRDRERVLTELRTVVTEADGPVDALTRWVDAMFALLADPRRKRRVLTFYSEEMQRTRGYHQELDRFEATQHVLLAQIIEDGRRTGAFPAADPGPDARSALASIEAGFTEQARRSTGADPRETAAQILRFILRALGYRAANSGTPS
ncbi:TetR/AcrR family transcriptional regulator [Mycolicibacterium hodleri]|uniref:TetR/AcrR family transcriptional regulator n=1 Tax=Mycolicibacterium hodleri TaxID=49897 RepID=UPI0013755D11|nr:TetR/AcrR family transcriptional regulator [Mycolicibacterium hodleri]